MTLLHALVFVLVAHLFGALSLSVPPHVRVSKFALEMPVNAK